MIVPNPNPNSTEFVTMNQIGTMREQYEWQPTIPEEDWVIEEHKLAKLQVHHTSISIQRVTLNICTTVSTHSLDHTSPYKHIIVSIHRHYTNAPSRYTHTRGLLFQPLLYFSNHVADLLSTKDDVLLFEYRGQMRHIIGIRDMMIRVAAEQCPGITVKDIRLETVRTTDKFDR